MSIARRTVVNVAVTHLRNEHILHRYLQIWVGVEDGIKGGSMARHIVVLQRDGRELMHRAFGGLHIISEFARNYVTFKITTPADDARRDLYK